MRWLGIEGGGGCGFRVGGLLVEVGMVFFGLGCFYCW
jgi:hypothetical protein